MNPVITNVPTDIMRNTNPGLPIARVTWNAPNASDDSGDVTLSSNFKSGDAFPIGETKVTYEAVDPSGNRVTVDFTVIVKGRTCLGAIIFFGNGDPKFTKSRRQ